MKDIAFTQNKIIPILEETNDYIAGFDLITNKYTKVKKSACIISPKWIDHVFKDSNIQLQISNNIKESIEERCTMLGISDRTYHRYNNKFKIIDN